MIFKKKITFLGLPNFLDTKKQLQQNVIVVLRHLKFSKSF